MDNNDIENSQELNSLVNAFQNFNKMATSLSGSYHKLDDRIANLTNELEEKDELLYVKLKDLERMSHYVKTLLEISSSGVIAIDMQGKITLFNRAAIEMTGIRFEDAIKKDYSEVMESNPFESGPLYTLQNGPETKGVEKTLPNTEKRVEASTTWVIDSAGEKAGVIEIIDDITSIRVLEEKFEHQKTLTALGEMAAAVSHELRNPLAGIGGFAALLKEDLKDSPEQLELIERIIQGVSDLDKLAGKLLFLTRPVKVEYEQYPISDLIKEVVELLRSEVKEFPDKINISSELPAESDIISCDKDLLRMVLTNLGRNAIQSVIGDGNVVFQATLRLLVNRVDIEVIDDGCGIARENLNKLLVPFFTTRAEGTGLGLSLVKKALDFIKGELSFTSISGEGSTFKVSLPIRLSSEVLEDHENIESETAQ